MKKTFFSLAAVVVILLLAACNDDSYRHSISLVHPTPGYYGALYADQTRDSVVFSTFDSYKVTTDASWVTIDPNLASKQVENSYWYCWEFSVPLTFTPNTTGESRVSEVTVYNYGADDWNQTITASYLQYACHNISHPAYTIEKKSSTSGYPLQISYTLTDSALFTRDSLKFTAYDAWTLSIPEGKFVSADMTSGQAGQQTVYLTLTPNETSDADSTTITLKSSNGAATDIKIKQLGQLK